ncbi:MAG: tryptophan 2,3-dioxygenase family protein [Ktedonobacterales bacterium]
MSADAFAPRPSQRVPTTYETYLRTDELLSLQKPPEERLHPDELTFQVVHQTFELWWKVTVEQLDSAADWLRQQQADDAAHALRRAVSAGSVVIPALRQLEFVAPKDFLEIRTGLGHGSGGESPGFRAILRTVPVVWEAYTSLLSQTGVTLLDLYQEPRRHAALYDCAEALTDFDEQFHLFRAAHLKLAQRNLGLRAIGTGGTPMPALEKTLRDLLFPPLWEVRDELLARAASLPGHAGDRGQVTTANGGE